LTLLLGIAAISLDGGVLLTERRHAQATADAAARAAACDLYANFAINGGSDPKGTAAASALATASANGYANDGITSTVTVNIPPKSGDHVAIKGYAEVLVEFNQGRMFSSIFGSGAIPVHARAVAAGLMLPGGGGAGIIVLNPKVSKSLNVTGPGSVVVKSGKIIVDSSDSNAAVITGSGNVDSIEVDVTGTKPGYSYASSGQFVNGGGPGNVKTGKPPTPDPLASLPEPDPTTLTTRSLKQLNINSNKTLQPGRYIGGIGIAGGTITMQPGIYYMDQGGFSVSNGTVNGSGVMIFNNPVPASGQKVTMTGGNFDLTAPTSGTYQGVVIFQARAAGNVPIAITGPGTSKMLGTVYAASSPVAVTGQGGATIGSQFISDTLTVTGAGPFTVDWAGQPSPPGGRVLRLTE
jgi:hypothetical protein